MCRPVANEAPRRTREKTSGTHGSLEYGKQESPKGDFLLDSQGAIFSEGRGRLYTIKLP